MRGQALGRGALKWQHKEREFVYARCESEIPLCWSWPVTSRGHVEACAPPRQASCGLNPSRRSNVRKHARRGRTADISSLQLCIGVIVGAAVR